MGIKIIKDGSIRGAWIATGITVAWVIAGLTGLGFALCTNNDMSGFIGVYTVFTGGSLSYVAIYFLKKYKEFQGETEILPDLGGVFDRGGVGGDERPQRPQNITAGIRDRSRERPIDTDTD